MPDRPKLEASGVEQPSELERRDQEIRRLRDLLLTRDAELGEAKGRLAEMENYAGLLLNLAARVQARVPALTRFAGNILRRLQGRQRREGG